MTQKSMPTALDLPMVDPLPDDTQKYFDICQDKLGMIPNVLQAYAFDIAKLNSFTMLYNELMLADSGLSKLEREMIAVAVSAVNRCYYCLTAHGQAVRALSGDPILGEQMVMNWRVADLSSSMIPAQQVARFSSALPFFLSVILIPLVWIGAILGGWWVIVTPLVAWYLFSAIDLAVGLNTDDADLETTEDQLYWYKLITQLWVPLQFVTLFGVIAYISRAAHLGGWESFGIMFGMGVMTGTVGIVYAHELLHQKGKFERRLGDLLLAMVLYSHFRSEHLLVHHRYVGTPRDPVTARYNEGFHRFYPRVLKQCWHSAFKAERDMLARKKLPWHHKTNPFWLYWGLQAGMMGFALIVGGWFGLMLFAVQAGIAIWQLEVVNYVVRAHDDPVLDVMAIDNLPSLLPLESSEDFAAQLLPHLQTLNAIDDGVWGRAFATYSEHKPEVSA